MAQFVIGTRRSRLARFQTALVGRLIAAQFPDTELSERIVVTEGDRRTDVSLAGSGVDGFFTRALEERLLDGSIDAAVHSFKDLPTALPDGLVIAAAVARREVEDALVAEPGLTLATLPPGARVGTGSLRRAAQLRRMRPDVRPMPIRGNVETRIAKVDKGEYDALILASPGLYRLGLQDRIAAILDMETWYYAPAQGALAVEIRADDERARAMARAIDDHASRVTTTAERAFLAELAGGCRLPLGVRCRLDGNTMRLGGMVCGADGEPFYEGEEQGSADRADELGRRLARRLLAMGADRVLAEERNQDSGKGGAQ